MSIYLNQPSKIPIEPNSSNLNGKENETEELTEYDKSALSLFGEIVTNQESLVRLKDSLKNSINWQMDFQQLISLENKENGQLTKKGLIEIIKLIVKSSSANFITDNLRNSGIDEESSRLEIAKACIETSFYSSMRKFDSFGIKNNSLKIEFYKHCVEWMGNDVKHFIENFPQFDITNQKALIAIVTRIAAFRPDLVLRNINQFGLNKASADAVILKCAELPPNPTTKLITFWMRENKDRLSSITNFPFEKIKMKIKITPNNAIQKIIELFKHFAENPDKEIVGRKCWRLSHTENGDALIELLTPSKIKEMVALSKCLTTVTALETAIFGVDNPAQNQMIFKSDELDNFWQPFLENEKKFEGKPPSHFFAYSIDCGDYDHTFMIIQYKDEEGIKYRILQSWVENIGRRGHSLDEYMTKRGEELSEEDFLNFREGFNHVVSNGKWTPETRIFFAHYFMRDEELRQIGADYHFSSKLGLQWGASNLDAILMHKAQFETFKEKHIVKSIKSTL